MKKLNPKTSSNYLLKLILETNKDLVSEHRQPLISLAMAESLDREAHGVPQSSHTSSASSHSRYSDSYSWYKWRKYEYPKFWKRIKRFIHYRKYNYKDKSFNRRHCYYKFVTVKPLKNSLLLTEKISREIIHELRRNRHTAMILRSIENSWTYSGDNYHTHLLIISTSKISKRSVSAVISKTIHSKHTTNIENIWNLKQLVCYMTKQCGYFPLMTKGNDKTKKPQIQILRSFPLSKQKAMIAHDVRTNYGLQRHKLYFNSKNAVIKSIKAHTSKPQHTNTDTQNDITAIYQYLEEHRRLLKYYDKQLMPTWWIVAKVGYKLGLKLTDAVNPRIFNPQIFKSTDESSKDFLSLLTSLNLRYITENVINKLDNKYIRKHHQLKDKLTYELLAEQHGKLWQSTIIWARSLSTTIDDIKRRLNTPKGQSVPLFTAKATPTSTTANGRKFTRHHTSNNEALSRFYGRGYYSYSTVNDRDVPEALHHIYGHDYYFTEHEHLACPQVTISLFKEGRSPVCSVGIGTTLPTSKLPHVEMRNSLKIKTTKKELSKQYLNSS